MHKPWRAEGKLVVSGEKKLDYSRFGITGTAFCLGFLLNKQACLNKTMDSSVKEGTKANCFYRFENDILS